MASIDVIKSCIDSIRQISEHIEGGIVYLDAGVTESFQFIGAYPVLLEIGARAVCSLENMSVLDAMSHSVFPDSPLGPDAYHEYESLLVQDYEELISFQWRGCSSS
ncbi:hypothetical protein L195_g016871 [Trifolium pratense]|uniref:Uncharacterized protein n=1 Tax=Trifolium pratense TaxID=57577 RepID=A0A2K3MSL4_TRIPR|nr:hypothetical protein L195_g016871 [Trifolium pratense]